MIEKNILQNGLRVLGQKYKDSFATSVIVLVKTGSRNETDKISGISHFLEHMNFKGTTKRPTSLDITKELDSMGAEYNAMTDKEFTGYHIKSDKGHFEKSLEILADMAFNSKIEPQELEKEKGTIIEEINMYEDTPLYDVYDLFDEIFYPKIAMSHNVVGKKEIIQSISSDTMRGYRDEYYGAGNVIVSCAGGLPKNYLKIVENFFSFVPKGEKNYLSAEEDNKLFSKRVILKSKELEQTHVVMGLPTFDIKDQRKYAMRILSTILGGTMSSRLFSEVREKRGLAYYISSSVSEGFDSGALRIRAGLNVQKAYEAVKVISDEVQKIQNSVTHEELKRAKDYIKGTLALSEEDSMNAAIGNAAEELMGSKALTLAERIKIYEKVTMEDLQELSREVLDADKLKLAIIGPFKEEEKFAKILGD